MSAPWLDELEQAFRSGARDLNTAAEMCGIDFESACLSFNNGLLKGYWRIVVNADGQDPEFDPKLADEAKAENEQ